MKSLLFFTLSFIITNLNAQNLLPSIGQSTTPNDSDPIVSMAFYNDPDGSFQTPGPEVGDTVPDFTLYDITNNGITLSEELQNGKYVLLVAGSYTCPVFRNKIQAINDIVNNYPGDVTVYVIYEEEAHPDVDISFYFGYVNPGSQNINAGILHRQPTNYGERKDMVEIMNDSMVILAPILLDLPGNNFLSYFGPAPNNAYLIDTNGVVVVKHGWFDKYPLDMSDDIDSILGLGGGNPVGTNGTFNFQMTTDTIDIGMPGEVLYVEGEFTNTHATDDVIINLFRSENNLPDQTWSSSMCINACLNSSIGNYNFQIPAGATQQFVFYFFNGSQGQANAELIMTNVNNSSNTFTKHFYGMTDSTLSLNQISKNNLEIYPNPSRDKIFIKSTSGSTISSIDVIDILGRIVLNQNNLISNNGKIEVDLSSLQSDYYFLIIHSQEGIFTEKIIKQ